MAIETQQEHPVASADRVGSTSEHLKIRVHNPDASPKLIYFPGLHGDWTLVRSFRQALAGRVCFVEMTYPRTLNWSLEDYAAAIETALAERGISSGWLLGESFGSQVVWALVERRQFQVDGAILAGGFLRHPMPRGARMVEHIIRRIPVSLVKPILAGYEAIGRFRYRRAPEVLADLAEFVSRRTDLDRRAAEHRLRLVAENDPSHVPQGVNLPVYALTGILDPIVPWPWARRALKRHCSTLREYKVLWRADHTVLASAPRRSAKVVLRWITTQA
jgi:pimeloyl-ACP methyl ester carboxylesterase